MDYLVIGEDGSEYGPADLPTIKAWVAEGRVHATTKLKNFQTGATLTAGSLVDLFPPVTIPPPAAAPRPGNSYATPPTNYPRGGPKSAYTSNDGSADVWWAIGRSVLTVVLALVRPGYGLISGAYGIWRGAKAYQ